MTTLGELSQGNPKVLVDTVAVINQIHSLAADAHLPWHEYSPQAFLAALYQDDDAHDTCSLTACLNPLHPGPCKGWKGTLFDTAPGAWHSLEAAKVEKANAARIKKIEALKQAGKPIPHKLLQPIVAKPHPHVGQTANKASGGAHEAGQDVTESSGIKPSTPGKVSLGMASKALGPVQTGPKGKKPTLASKGIAFVISQPKVTDQYKLDKASAITPEQWASLSKDDQATIRGELAKIKKDGFGPQQKKADELLAKLPVGTPPKEPTKLSEVATPNTKVAESKPSVADVQAKAKTWGTLGEASVKPKPLPKHVEDAIAMAKGQAPGASWSKNHLAAYQHLSADEFHSLPKDVQAKVVSELEKGKSKFLDPKKVQAAKDLLEKFGHGEGKKVAAPKIENVEFGTHLHDHNVTQKQAADAAKAAPISAHFEVAKQVAGVTEAENPDSIDLAKEAIAKAKVADAHKTQMYTQDILKQPQVKAAMEKYHDANALDFNAKIVHDAKTKAYNKITTKLAHGDDLSPIEKASLLQYQSYLLKHPVKTSAEDMDKLAADQKAAGNELDTALHAAVKKANAPKPDQMSDAQIADRAKELLGDNADSPNLYLSLAETKASASEAKTVTSNVYGSKYPPEVLADPQVATKLSALQSAMAQQVSTKGMLDKLGEHTKAVHGAVLQSGTDIHGNQLTADDKKVISLHVGQLMEKHDHLNTTLASQNTKIIEAKKAFEAAADKAVSQGVGKPAPIALTDFDKSAISDAYTEAWAKHVNKAVTYGLKTYAQKEQMKNHPDYQAFTQDLGNLKTLAGKLALAHAEAHMAHLNAADAAPGSLDEQEALHKQYAVDNLDKQFNDLHKLAQARLDTIRIAVGLKKRALPKLDTSAVKATAAEKGFYKSTAYNGPNYGKAASGKQYILAKAGPKIGVAHKTTADKAADKAGKLGGGPSAPSTSSAPSTPAAPVNVSGGDISHIPDALKKQITNDFKSAVAGKYLADPAETIFTNLVNVAGAHGKSVPGGLSVDQVLKTVDETHAKNLGVANSGMMHKKITDWLATPGGASYAKNTTPDPAVVKALTGEIDLPKGVTLKPGEKVQPLAGPGPHDTSLDEKAFKPLTALQAQQAQDAWMAKNGVKWSAAQKSAIKSYTGSTYTTYNGYLRGTGHGTPATKQAVINIQSAMMPLAQHTLLKRGTGWPPELASYASDPKKLMGKTFEDKAFVSTTVAGSSGHFSSQPLQLTIEAPEGTPAAFINSISHFKGQENEMLLAAGTKFKVLSVSTDQFGHTHMRVRIVGDK